MARKKSTPPAKLSHHWYLPEWAEQAGKKQADAIRELDWPRSTASALWNGHQRYNQEYIDQVAVWLNVRPFELLLPVSEAMAIRRMRDAAATIVESDRSPNETAPEAVPLPVRARR